MNIDTEMLEKKPIDFLPYAVVDMHMTEHDYEELLHVVEWGILVDEQFYEYFQRKGWLE